MTHWVLDVGCGHRPHRRANVFIDKYKEGHSERKAEISNLPDNFIVAEMENLPFKEKSIAHCFCRQVLEHAERPELALQEMARVSKEGWITTPHLFRELVSGKTFHRWLVAERGGVLVLLQKYKREGRLFKGKLLALMRRAGGLFDIMREAGLNKVRYRWIDKIYYVVIYSNGECFTNL